MKYRKAVFVVTYRKEKDRILYLLLKRKLHWKGYEFPKGGINDNENLLKAAKRELKEETGQKAKKIIRYNLSGKYRYAKAYPDRKGFNGQTYTLFSAEIRGKKVNIDKLEHSSYIWAELKQAVKMLKWSNQKRCLRYVNKELK